MARGLLKLSGRTTLTRALPKDGSRLYIEMSFALGSTPTGVHSARLPWRALPRRRVPPSDNRRCLRPNWQHQRPARYGLYILPCDALPVRG